MQNPLFIYTALPCEAKPFIDHFRLKKDLGIQAFAVFTRGNICLTVTGIGKSAMAAGVAYTQALFARSPNPVLVNIGIAGHQNQPLGRLFLANKITDADSLRCYYPPLVFRPPCASAGVQTSAGPQLDYPHGDLCDMEASAFYETAARFTSGELIQTMKVVSDNPGHSVAQVTPQMAGALLAAQLEGIVQILMQLDQLAPPLAVVSPLLAGLVARFRFSASERQQLKTKLARWELLGGQTALDDMLALPDGKAVLTWLDERIQGVAFYL